MNSFKLLLAAASLGALAACGGEGDDQTGDIVARDSDAAADAMERGAENMSGAAADIVEKQADAVREAGQQAEEAIDEADIKTANPAAAAARIEAQTGLPSTADTAEDAAKPER